MVSRSARRKETRGKGQTAQRTSDESAAGCLIGIFITLAALWWFGVLSTGDTPTGNETVDQQLATLENTAESLRHVLQHVERQQSDIRNRQNTIADLSERESSIRSFIETNREHVDAILDDAARRRDRDERASFWTTAVVSFCLGLLSNAAFHGLLEMRARIWPPSESNEDELADNA